MTPANGQLRKNGLFRDRGQIQAQHNPLPATGTGRFVQTWQPIRKISVYVPPKVARHVAFLNSIRAPIFVALTIAVALCVVYSQSIHMVRKPEIAVFGDTAGPSGNAFVKAPGISWQHKH